MKAPRKSELQRLQALYKTDARIAEVLSVPEYLVTYWRRKKRLPRYSAPKFSREQIAELWARYGDDFRCGRELNISKAAYYSWRRKYDIIDRPAVLKLEQLELRLASDELAQPTSTTTAPKTGAQKIVDRCRTEWPQAIVPVDWRIFRPENGPASAVALSSGPDPQEPRSQFAPDAIPITDIREPIWIAEELGSVEWQVAEARAVQPGQMVLGPDHTLAGLGGIGCLYLTESDASEIPGRVLRLEITRRLSARVDVEDVVFALLARDVDTDWNDAIVEFLGAPIERLPIDRKMKLCSLVVHQGARAALCPFDDVMRRHYGRHLRGRFPQSHPDRTAIYDGEHFLEGRGVEPAVGRTDESGRFQLLARSDVEPAGVLIGPDALPYEIEEAATVLRGRRLASGSSLLVKICSLTIFPSMTLGRTRSSSRASLNSISLPSLSE